MVYIFYYQSSKGEYARIEASRCRTATLIDGIFDAHLRPLKILILISVFPPQKDFKSLLSNAGQRSRIEFELLFMVANWYLNICIFSNVWYFLTTKFDEFSSRFFIHVIICYKHLKKI